MLLRFGAKNFLSLYERQDFSLVATSLKGPDIAQFKLPSSPKLNILPAAVIYGANASGKTNLIKAFQFLRQKVLYSHSRGDPTGGVSRTPFALNSAAEESPTAVDIDFVVDGVRYSYGFEANDKEFVSEWLYSFPEGNRRKLFERNGNEVEFGATMKGAKRLLTEFMRPNSLFLSTATQNDHEELSKLVKFFLSSVYSDYTSIEGHFVNYSLNKQEIDNRVIKFLDKIGTGVVSYRKKENEIAPEVKSFTKKFFDLTKKEFGNNLSIGENINLEVSIELGHCNSDGEVKYFSIERESSGTRRLLIILDSVFKALDTGSLIIIDELDASLHTHAAELILCLFCDPEVNKNGAQLLTTTHDTNLMQSSSLRRDQIWFAEKDFGGATHVFPLSDIKTRQEDNFETGYLQGRYGAIPFSGNAKTLFGGYEHE